MSQSEMHRRLVVNVAQAISVRHPQMRLTLDILDAPGDLIPSSFNGHRPDILGMCTGTCLKLVIAEAKTNRDIDNRHTRSQVGAFLHYLDSMKFGTGTFILAVNGEVASSASTFLKFNYRHRVSPRVQVKLFDGLDFWTLGPPGDELWHLS